MLRHMHLAPLRVQTVQMLSLQRSPQLRVSLNQHMQSGKCIGTVVRAAPALPYREPLGGARNGQPEHVCGLRVPIGEDPTVRTCMWRFCAHKQPWQISDVHGVRCLRIGLRHISLSDQCLGTLGESHGPLAGQTNHLLSGTDFLLMLLLFGLLVTPHVLVPTRTSVLAPACLGVGNARTNIRANARRPTTWWHAPRTTNRTRALLRR